MKSGRTKPPLSSANVQPSSSRILNSTCATTATAFSATLRNPPSTVTHTRTRPASGSTTATGRKSPQRTELANAKAKRTFTNPNPTAKAEGPKSMKKHFLSKSNDSLSGGSSAAKKARNQPISTAIIPTAQSRGIRHPAVLQNKSKDKEALQNSPVAESLGNVYLISTRSATPCTSDGEPAQEMRRSVSSNCLDVATLSRDDQRRLSIPDVNCASETSNMPTISLLNSNFALAPSQPGIALVSFGTQTDYMFSVGEDDLVLRSSQQQRIRPFSRELGSQEFQKLMEENSLMSKEISELCKMDSPTGGSAVEDTEMYEPDGGCSSKHVDWDSQSNNSLCSEPSLVCLQDRIQQMEETHHSTHEELQATLQELAEMGDLVTAYRKENEDLLQEKNVLQETLCAMTEKVHVYQTQADSLKKMLYRQANDENSPEGMEAVTEAEKTLVDLMKNLHNEKEELHEQLESALEQNSKLLRDLDETQSKLQNLDNWCDDVEAKKKETEQILSTCREGMKRQEMEISRLAALLETEKCKVTELQTVAKTTAKADVEELLDHVRIEKIRIEEQLTNANTRIRVLENDLEVTRELLKTTEEKRNVREQDLTNTVHEFAERLAMKEVECEKFELDVNRLKKELEDMEITVRTAEQERCAIQEQNCLLQSQLLKEQREWDYFQNDLLTAVRVANDFRTECELRVKSIGEENQLLKRKTDDLATEVERLKTKKSASSPVKIGSSEVCDVRTRLDPLPLRSPVEREPLTSRTPRTPNHQTVSVKSLVQNMESNLIGARQGPRAVSSATKVTGIRRRDDNIVRSESNSSLDSTDKLLDFDKSLDDEPSVPGDGLKPILNMKQRNSLSADGRSERKDSSAVFDPLGSLAKGKGSKRNALLKFCQEKTLGYSGIDITNFSSSWNDGLAFCALLHSYLPDRIPYKELDNKDKRRNFTLAFDAAKSVGVSPTLDISDLLSDDRPDWRAVMDYVISIYKHFEM